MSNAKNPPPVPTVPTGMDDFARFDRELGNSLSQIVTEGPSGPVPPVQAPGFDTPVLLPGNVVQSPDRGVNPEEQALLAHRAMLAVEEERLKYLQKPPPIHTGPVGGMNPSALGSQMADVVVRGEADPLHVESWKFLRRIVATGSPLLGMLDHGALTRHIGALKDAIEYKPKVVPEDKKS